MKKIISDYLKNLKKSLSQNTFENEYLGKFPPPEPEYINNFSALQKRRDSITKEMARLHSTYTIPRVVIHIRTGEYEPTIIWIDKAMEARYKDLQERDRYYMQETQKILEKIHRRK